MKIEWKEMPKKNGRINTIELTQYGFYEDGYIEFPLGCLFKHKDGNTILVGHCSRNGGYSDEWHYTFNNFTHYSTSLVDHLQKEIPELYKK